MSLPGLFSEILDEQLDRFAVGSAEQLAKAVIDHRRILHGAVTITTPQPAFATFPAHTANSARSAAPLPPSGAASAAIADFQHLTA